MSAVQTKGLHAPVPTIRNHEDGILTAGIHEEAVRRVEFGVTVARPADFSEEFSARRKSQNMVRAVAITYIKISVWSEGDVGGNKINGPRCIGRVFTRVAVCPKGFALQRGLRDLALIDIAVIENFRASLAAHTKAMRATSKLASERAHEASRRVVNNQGLSTHAGFVHRVGHTDVALRILRQTVGVSPNQAFRRHEPVVNTLVGVRPRAHNRQATAGLAGGLQKERRQKGRSCRCRGVSKEPASSA